MTNRRELSAPVKWKAGTADEPWKVMVSARDAAYAEEMIGGLAYILDNPGFCDLEAQANVIRRFSGDQIADALLDYHAKAFQGVKNAL